MHYVSICLIVHNFGLFSKLLHELGSAVADLVSLAYWHGYFSCQLIFSPIVFLSGLKIQSLCVGLITLIALCVSKILVSHILRLEQLFTCALVIEHDFIATTFGYEY